MVSDNRRSPLRVVLTALVTVSIAMSGMATIEAQDGEDIARGLLRALLESQLERQRRKHDPFRPPAPPSNQTSQAVFQLRTISSTLAQEAASLSAVVNTDARRDYHLRRQLPGVLQLEASAGAVQQQTAVATHERDVIEAYRRLNSEWLTLAYQLRNQPGLSAQALSVVDRIDRLDGQYCAVLQLQQQFDSQQLVRASTLLSASLQQLNQELQYNVPSSATRRRLLRQLRHHQNQSNYFAVLVADSQRLDAVVQEYQRLYRTWTVLQSDLDRYQIRSVTRAVQRVVAGHQTIHQLLRLDFGLDRQLMLHLIQDVETTMTELFQRVTLADLMSLPGSDDVSSAADTAYGTLQHLRDVVRRNESRQEVGDAWVYMNEAWDLVAFHLQSVQRPEVRHHLDEVAGELTALREILGAAVVWDPAEMVRRASNLESLATSIHQSMRRWHRAAGITDVRGLQEARELTGHCRQLKQRMIARRPPAGLRGDCDRVTQSWQVVQSHLHECQTPERENLDRLSAEFTPELVRILTSLPE